MSHPIDILLDLNTSDADKYLAAEEIIHNYEINLTPVQIQLAMNKVLNYEHNPYSIYDKLESKIILFKSVLKDNISMFVALILAIIDGFKIKEFRLFLHINLNRKLEFGGYVIPYIKLLDFYDFDVNKVKICNYQHQQQIIDYRNDKYAGKMTKRAIQ